jgi:hypothetical protein
MPLLLYSKYTKNLFFGEGSYPVLSTFVLVSKLVNSSTWEVPLTSLSKKGRKEFLRELDMEGYLVLKDGLSGSKVFSTWRTADLAEMLRSLTWKVPELRDELLISFANSTKPCSVIRNIQSIYPLVEIDEPVVETEYYHRVVVNIIADSIIKKVPEENEFTTPFYTLDGERKVYLGNSSFCTVDRPDFAEKISRYFNYFMRFPTGIGTVNSLQEALTPLFIREEKNICWDAFLD